jgi:hypothetical protein
MSSIGVSFSTILFFSLSKLFQPIFQNCEPHSQGSSHRSCRQNIAFLRTAFGSTDSIEEKKVLIRKKNPISLGAMFMY